MAYILENNVLKLECTEKGGEMLHLVKRVRIEKLCIRVIKGGLDEILLYFQW